MEIGGQEAMKTVKMCTSFAVEFMHGMCTARYVGTRSRCTKLISENMSYVPNSNFTTGQKGSEEQVKKSCMIMTCICESVMAVVATT